MVDVLTMALMDDHVYEGPGHAPLVNGIPTGSPVGTDFDPSAPGVPKGWVILSQTYDPKTGYYAEALGRVQFDASGNPILDANGNFVPSEIVIANRGTTFSQQGPNPDRGPNIEADAGIVLGSTASDALHLDLSILGQGDQFYQQVRAQFPGIGITETGQSLGGSIADYVSLFESIKLGNTDAPQAITFNALGVGKALGDIDPSLAPTDLLTNYFIENDVLTQSLAGGLVGRQIPIGSLDGAMPSADLLFVLPLFVASAIQDVVSNALTAHGTPEVIAQIFMAQFGDNPPLAAVQILETLYGFDPTNAANNSKIPKVILDIINTALGSPPAPEPPSFLGQVIDFLGTAFGDVAHVIGDAFHAVINFIQSGLGSASDVAAAETVLPGIYVLRPGDTLDSVAAQLNVDPTTLAALNKDFISGVPTAGEAIRVPIDTIQITGSSASLQIGGSGADGIVYLVDAKTGTVTTSATLTDGSDNGQVILTDGTGNVVGRLEAGTVQEIDPNTTTGGTTLKIILADGPAGESRQVLLNSDGSGVVLNNGETTNFDTSNVLAISADGEAAIFNPTSTQTTTTIWSPSGFTSPTLQDASFLTPFAQTGKTYLQDVVSQLGVSGDTLNDISTHEEVDDASVSQRVEMATFTDSSGHLVTVTLTIPSTGTDTGSLSVSTDFGDTAVVKTFPVNIDATLGTATVSILSEVNPPALGLTEEVASSTGIESAINASVSLDTPSGPVNNSIITQLSVVDLGDVPLGEQPLTVDPTSTVAGGAVISTGDALVVDPNINTNGLVNTSTGGDISGEFRPGNQILSAPNQNLNDVLDNPVALDPTSNNNFGNLVGDAATDAPSFLNIDPLVLDLNGDGIDLPNLITNNIYFDTNVIADPNHAGQFVADGQLHHTSWVNPDDGILVFDPGSTPGPITNITQTLSEFFQGKSFANGFAALASLAQPGATEFSAATALTDPNTGQSYFNEVMVWQDANQDGVSQPSELHTLASLGITSIDLQGSVDSGEEINGSSVTSTATFTSASGAKEVASIDLQTDTTGDIRQSASGGTVIQSFSEGSPTPLSTFVAQDSNAQSFTLSHGTLTDTTSGQTVATGITAVLSSTEGDIIAVDPSDTATYWLGGGTGADTLIGGAGNTVFLMNATTVVRGGKGFNIAKVTGSQGVTVDLMEDNLQEVIGAAGDSVFNASGTTWNVFLQGGSGNNIMIGGAARDAISGGTGDDLIEAGSGGSVIHAGSGNDVIFGGSGTDPSTGKPNSDLIYGGPGHDVVTFGTNNSIFYAGTGSATVIGNAKGFSVVSFHGSYADYTVTHNTDGSITVTNNNGMDGDGAVTMTNVAALDFKDISQVSLTNGRGLPVNDVLNTGNSSQVQTNSSGQYVIAASTLLANDLDYSGNTLSIRELLDNNGKPIARGASGVANGGTVALSADGSTITFTPTARFNGVMSFRYHVVDSQGNDGTVVNQVGTTNTAEMTATVYLNTPSQPTDPLFDSEWYLQAADILPVWSNYRGQGVSIGVFDPSGNVDFSNPDLAANAGIEKQIDGSPGIQQLGTHATLVAGVIAAAQNGQGAVGVANEATISSEALPTTFNPDAPGNLADWQNYDVVNNSFNISPPFSDNFLATDSNGQNPYRQAFVDAVTKGRNGLGTIIVVAGGNNRADGRNTDDINLTNSRFAITVGGINAQTDLGSLQIGGAPFSNPGATILVSAPASNISSDGITFTNEFGQTFGADVQTTQGTSFATPIVTGVVALMLQANPNLTYRDVQQILAYSAVLVPTTSGDPFDPTRANFVYNSASNWNGGGLHVSNDYGYGEVDALAAVRLAETWVSEPGLSSLTVGVGATATIPANGTATLNFDPSKAINAPSLWNNLGIEHIDVVLTISNHNQAGDLVLTLISPTGTRSVLMYHPGQSAANPQGNGAINTSFTFGTDRDIGEHDGAGNWQLQITDTANDPTGSVTINSVSFYGHNTAAQPAYVYTNEFASLSNDPNNASRGTLTDSSGNAVLNAAAIASNSVIDLRAGSIDSVLAGRSLTIGAGTTVRTAFGGDGNDTIIGNDAGDLLSGGRGNDTLIGGAGNDTFIGGAGNKPIIGGGGVNTVEYLAATAAATTAVVVNLATGVVLNEYGGSDTLIGIQNAVIADDGGTVIGGSGTETLSAAGAGDTVIGGSGSSTLFSGGGGNTLESGSGTAVAVYNGDGLAASLATGTAGFNGSGALDTLVGIGDLVAIGNNETLFAGSGSETLSATGVLDTLVMASGTNTFFGGTGSDTFIVQSAAVASGVNQPQNLIGDFKVASDKIDLTHFAAIESFSDLSFATVTFGGQSYLQVNLGGGQSITIANVTASQLSSANFVFHTVSAPTLSVQNASGIAGSVISLGVNTALADVGSSETLSVVITGLPSVATLSAGTKNANGTWSLTPAQLSGLTVTAPAGSFAGTTTLTVTATAAGNGKQASSSEQLVLAIAGVATAPNLNVQNTGGAAGSNIPLSVSAALTATDGTESLSITITGVPTGASLSAGTKNTDGSWTLSPAQLSGLTLTTPTNFTGANLQVRAAAVETDGSVASTIANLSVAAGSVTAPTLTVQNASGNAGSAIVLAISSTVANQETLSINIAGVPDGANLSAGTHNADGTWTLSAAQLSGLTLTAPAGSFAGTANLTVTAIATQTSNGLQSSRSEPLAVSIAGVATAPSLDASDASGAPGSTIPLSIDAGLTATDGTEKLSVKIAGVPSVVTLSAGTKNSDGSWSLSAGQLASLSVTTPSGTTLRSKVTVTATATETDGSQASTLASFVLTVGNPDAQSTAGSHVVLNGGAAQDTLISTGSSNTLIAGSGLETLIGGGSGDTLIADGGPDTLISDVQNNTLIAGTGQSFAATPVNNATVNLASGTIRINGKSSGDTLVGITRALVDGTADTIVANNAGDTLLSASASGDTLISASGNDTLLSAQGTGNTLIGGSGTDLLESDNGRNDVLRAGGGPDVVEADNGSHDTLVAGGGLDTLMSTLFGSNNTLIGGAGNDTLISDGPSGDVLIAGSGANSLIAGVSSDQDTLIAGGANAVLISKGELNTLVAGSNGDTLISFGIDDTIQSNAAGNTLEQSATPSFAGSGLVASYHANNLLINLAAGIASINGSHASDTLIGISAAAVTGNSDTLIADGGVDTLSASGSNDTLLGGSGLAVLGSNAGGNTLKVGSGTAIAAYTANNLTVNLASGTAGINGSSAKDTLIGMSGAIVVGSGDTVLGGSGLSTLGSNAGGNTLKAGAGGALAFYGVDNVIVNLATGGASVQGASASDTLLGIGGAIVAGNNDAVLAGGGAQTLVASGFGNNNTLVAGTGSDVLVSNGEGGNTLVGGSGKDTLISDGFDQLIAGASNTLIANGPFDGFVSNGGGNTLLASSDAMTQVTYSVSNLTVNLSTGTASVNGSHTSDTLSGVPSAEVTGRNDTVVAGGSAGTLFAEGGADTLIGGSASVAMVSDANGNTLIGGTGAAIVTFNDFNTGLSNLVVNLATGTASVSGSAVQDTLIGIAGASILGLNDTVIAGAGNETLTSLGENESVIAATGSAAAGGGIDTLMDFGDGNTLVGGSGTSTLIGQAISGTLMSGSGSSMAFYDRADVAVNLAIGSAVEQDFGGADTLIGITRAAVAASNDTAIADGGNDTLFAMGVQDTLIGGSGLSTLISNVGGNTLEAGTGTSVAFYSGNGLIANLAAGTVSFTGATGGDTLLGIGAVTLAGNNETLIAGTGAETLAATGNFDTLVMTSGANTFFGGSGSDTFLVLLAAVASGINQPQNLIGDFSVASDKVDLTHFAALTSFADLSFATVTFGSQSYLQINLGGGQSITMANVTLGALGAGNFIFHPVTAPSLSAQNASGNAGNAIPLNVAAALSDSNSSETLSIVIAGIPAAASLSAGVQNADGSWTLTPADLPGLSLEVPAGAYAGTSTLTVTATAAAQANAGQASTSEVLNLSIAGVATAPTLAVQNVSGSAGSPIPLSIASALTATDGTESLSVNIAGLPGGASLSAGTRNSDGSWTLTSAQLSGPQPHRADSLRRDHQPHGDGDSHRDEWFDGGDGGDSRGRGGCFRHRGDDGIGAVARGTGRLGQRRHGNRAFHQRRARGCRNVRDPVGQYCGAPERGDPVGGDEELGRQLDADAGAAVEPEPDGTGGKLRRHREPHGGGNGDGGRWHAGVEPGQPCVGDRGCGKRTDALRAERIGQRGYGDRAVDQLCADGDGRDGESVDQHRWPSQWR
jgi:subtilisin-like proprotein convertase family protein/Ca2+-binding RTX toxin-like protein